MIFMEISYFHISQFHRRHELINTSDNNPARKSANLAILKEKPNADVISFPVTLFSGAETVRATVGWDFLSLSALSKEWCIDGPEDEGKGIGTASLHILPRLILTLGGPSINGSWTCRMSWWLFFSWIVSFDILKGFEANTGDASKSRTFKSSATWSASICFWNFETLFFPKMCCLFCLFCCCSRCTSSNFSREDELTPCSHSS